MSALPPKADMCGATRDVHFGPIANPKLNCRVRKIVGKGFKCYNTFFRIQRAIADSCTAPNSPIRSPHELWQSTRIRLRRSFLSWETSRDPVSGRSLGRTSSSPLGQSAKQVRSGVSSRPATSQLRSMSFGSHPCRALVHRVYD
jgi:hypothetical protein